MMFKRFEQFNLFNNNSGSALIITLLLVSILVGLVVNFVYEVYIDTSTLSNWSNAQKASLIAKSGQTLGALHLKEVKENQYTHESELKLPVDKEFGVNTVLSIKIEDENAKFNINSIIYPKGTTNKSALSSLKKLFEYLNINPDLSLLIADWIDPDSEPRLPDSEDAAKNTFLWSINELKVIKGVDRDIFDKISPYLTVSGNSLININTAELPVLVSLHNDMTETLAKRIIDYRIDSPFENRYSIQRLSGFETIGQLIPKKITVKSSSFRIVAEAKVNEITRIIESVMDTSMSVHFWREG
jgi:general secretion pathway protein K